MKQAKVLTEAELKRVLALVAHGKHAQRNRLALLLSHYAGLRVGEIAALTWSNLLGPDDAVRGELPLTGRTHKDGRDARGPCQREAS